MIHFYSNIELAITLTMRIPENDELIIIAILNFAQSIITDLFSE